MKKSCELNLQTAALLLAFICLTCSRSWSQTKVIDERFVDWVGSDLIYDDIEGDGQQDFIDFDKLYMSNDDENIYLRIDIGQELNIQEIEDLVLYMDIDDDPNTGVSTQNFGADLVYGFGQRQGFVKVGNNFFDIFHEDINLVTLPTVSAREFEISISRSIAIFNGSVDMAEEIHLVMLDAVSNGDRIPDIGALPLFYDIRCILSCSVSIKQIECRGHTHIILQCPLRWLILTESSVVFQAPHSIP